MSANDPNYNPLPLARPTRNGAEAHAAAGAPVTLPGAVVPLVPERQAGPPALSAAPTASALFHALRRRWALALVLATLGAAAAVALVMELVPGQYTATALLQVSARSPSLAALLGESDAPPDAAAVRSNQAPIITSLNVLNAALNHPEVQALPAVQQKLRPAGWLARALKVEFKGAEVMNLSLSGQDAEEAQKLVNAVAEEYTKFMAGREEGKRRALLKQLEENFDSGEKSLGEKREHFLNLLREAKIDEPETARAKYDALLRQLQDVQHEDRMLSQDNIRLANELAKEKELIARLPKDGVPEGMLDKYLQEDPVYKQAITDLAKNDMKVRQVRSAYQGDFADRELESLRVERESIAKSLAEYRKAQQPRVVARFRADGELAVSKLASELSGVTKRQKFIRDELKRLQGEALRLTPSNQAANSTIEGLRTEIALKEEALKNIGNKMELLKIAPLLTSPVTLVQRAELPQSLDRSRQMKLAGAAGIGTFFLLLLGVSLWEFRSRKITLPDDVAEGLRLPLVGTLPALPARARQPLAGPASRRLQHMQERLSESVDSLRTLLLHAARAEDLQVVMVTSADAGEGKTSVASHLAASLARAWRKTLLVDADLRHPAIHALFNQPAEPGFSEVLRGEIGVQDAVRPTAVSRLWVMPAGHWDSHAVQALAQESVRSLFEELKGQYDFIVIDSCPLLPVADSLLLAQHVDGVLLSVLRNVSRAPAVHAAQQRLAGLGVRTLGAVMIGADGEAGAASYTYAAQTS
jgi:succinoglycan biosynthesis transport protein ExoP